MLPRYTHEFKEETAKQVLEHGYPIKETAERLGIHPHWKPTLTEVLAYIESHRGKLLIHRALKHYFDGKIKTQYAH